MIHSLTMSAGAKAVREIETLLKKSKALTGVLVDVAVEAREARIERARTESEERTRQLEEGVGRLNRKLNRATMTLMGSQR